MLQQQYHYPDYLHHKKMHDDFKLSIDGLEKELEAEGISSEIIDLRTVAPLDTDMILNSLSKTGRLLIATESVGMCGIAAEIAARAAEDGIFSLDAPIRRVCAKNAPVPFAPACEADVIPSEKDIVSAAREICAGI